jgi:hypothetical protein
MPLYGLTRFVSNRAALKPGKFEGCTALVMTKSGAGSANQSGQDVEDIAQNYVSVAGEAEVVVDRAKIGELWGIPAKAWWKSPDDPNIRLLKVTPVDAQYWDAPGSTVAYVKMAAAALTGSRPSMGENRKVKM